MAAKGEEGARKGHSEREFYSAVLLSHPRARRIKVLETEMGELKRKALAYHKQGNKRGTWRSGGAKRMRVSFLRRGEGRGGSWGHGCAQAIMGGRVKSGRCAVGE